MSYSKYGDMLGYKRKGKLIWKLPYCWAVFSSFPFIRASASVACRLVFKHGLFPRFCSTNDEG